MVPFASFSRVFLRAREAFLLKIERALMTVADDLGDTFQLILLAMTLSIFFLSIIAGGGPVASG